MDTIHGIPNVEHTPNKLAVSTDLTQEATKAISEALKSLIADARTLCVNAKNFHWHLAGSHFRDYHLLFAELADWVHRSGGLTLSNIRHISELQNNTLNNERRANCCRSCWTRQRSASGCSMRLAQLNGRL